MQSKKILTSVCTAFIPSSKGKTEERTNAIEEVGAAILNDPDLICAAAEYIKADCFLKAFELYVDKENPLLAELAPSIADATHALLKQLGNFLPT